MYVTLKKIGYYGDDDNGDKDHHYRGLNLMVPNTKLYFNDTSFTFILESCIHFGY